MTADTYEEITVTGEGTAYTIAARHVTMPADTKTDESEGQPLGQACIINGSIQANGRKVDGMNITTSATVKWKNADQDDKDQLRTLPQALSMLLNSAIGNMIDAAGTAVTHSECLTTIKQTFENLTDLVTQLGKYHPVSDGEYRSQYNHLNNAIGNLQGVLSYMRDMLSEMQLLAEGEEAEHEQPGE